MGDGMPKYRHAKLMGNLHIKFIVQFSEAYFAQQWNIEGQV